MALVWDAKNVKEWDKVDSSVKDAAIWSLLIVGMGEITKVSAPKFYARVRAYERITGNVLLGATPALVRSLIGLKANVSTESDAWFARKLRTLVADYAEQEWRREEDAE